MIEVCQHYGEQPVCGACAAEIEAACIEMESAFSRSLDAAMETIANQGTNDMNK